MNSLASELCLISACSRLNWIYCYFIYLFFKTFKIRIFKVKIIFPYFDGIYVQYTGNSYYLAGLYVLGIYPCIHLSLFSKCCTVFGMWGGREGTQQAASRTQTTGRYLKASSSRFTNAWRCDSCDLLIRDRCVKWVWLTRRVQTVSLPMVWEDYSLLNTIGLGLHVVINRICYEQLACW